MRPYSSKELAFEISMYGLDEALDRLNPIEVPPEMRLAWETAQTAHRHLTEMHKLIVERLEELQ